VAERVPPTESVRPIETETETETEIETETETETERKSAGESVTESERTERRVEMPESESVTAKSERVDDATGRVREANSTVDTVSAPEHSECVGETVRRAESGAPPRRGSAAESGSAKTGPDERGSSPQSVCCPLTSQPLIDPVIAGECSHLVVVALGVGEMLSVYFDMLGVRVV
jgi:hypothetical protein